MVHDIKFLIFSVDKYREMTSKKVKEAEENKSTAPSMKSVNPFDNLDCEYLISISNVLS